MRATASAAALTPSARAASPAAPFPRAAVLLPLVALAFAAAVAAPLALYTLSLALLGLPHALAELRFVAARFGPGRPRALLGAVLALLGLVVLLKIAALAGLLRGFGAARLGLVAELALALALAALALPRLWRRGLGFALAGGLLVAAVAVGTALAPLPTLLALAVLHTLTPLGFLAEGAGGPTRRSTLAWGALLFLGLPLLLASGWPLAAWHGALPLALEADPLGAGPLAHHFGAFFPAGWHGEAALLSAFAAVAFAQVMHQGTVLAVLPRLLLRPTPRWVWWGLAAAATVSLVTFSADFFGARQLYGVVAAVHAWVELPILLAALAGPLAPRQPRIQ